MLSLSVFPAATPFLSPEVLSGMVVDMFLKPGATTPELDFPMLEELRSYLNRLDSVLVVYHRKREKKRSRPDHFCSVFKTAVDADAFLKGWAIGQREAGVLKSHYWIQRHPDYPGTLLYELQQEIGLVFRALDSDYGGEPDRFRGPAFALLGPFEPSPLSLPSSLKEKYDCSMEHPVVGRARRVAEIEGRIEVLREELAVSEDDKRAR
ncbi:hypothetical protein RSOLAG22IIIB_13698 [Rhizoctonia solani]|uniref:Uncharacterized protein n=1 Tax=Rhizoctonia solani TaxID=456999 RepID=A0A0K6FQF2_9AGAM|nr:hypothetical protein RSOLAG22IIIB_13698 [Rhizoctonia solani]